MENKSLIRSDRSGGFCCLHVIPCNGTARWRPIFTGRRFRIICRRWWRMAVGSTVFFGSNILRTACDRSLIRLRLRIRLTLLPCRGSISKRYRGPSAPLRLPIILIPRIAWRWWRWISTSFTPSWLSDGGYDPRLKIGGGEQLSNIGLWARADMADHLGGCDAAHSAAGFQTSAGCEAKQKTGCKLIAGTS